MKVQWNSITLLIKVKDQWYAREMIVTNTYPDTGDAERVDTSISISWWRFLQDEVNCSVIPNSKYHILFRTLELNLWGCFSRSKWNFTQIAASCRGDSLLNVSSYWILIFSGSNFVAFQPRCFLCLPLPRKSSCWWYYMAWDRPSYLLPPHLTMRSTIDLSLL